VYLFTVEIAYEAEPASVCECYDEQSVSKIELKLQSFSSGNALETHFISSVCQHTMKGSQRCITTMCAVHASLT